MAQSCAWQTWSFCEDLRIRTDNNSGSDQSEHTRMRIQRNKIHHNIFLARLLLNKILWKKSKNLNIIISIKYIELKQIESWSDPSKKLDSDPKFFKPPDPSSIVYKTGTGSEQNIRIRTPDPSAALRAERVFSQLLILFNYKNGRYNE